MERQRQKRSESLPLARDSLEELFTTLTVLPSLNSEESARAIDALRADPSVTPEQFLRQQNCIGQSNGKLPSSPRYFTDPRMSELLVQSQGDMKNFIALGNYRNIASAVVRKCSEYSISKFAVEDFVQFFMTETRWMEHIIEVYDQHKEGAASFSTFLSFMVNRLFLDTLRNGTYARRLLVDQKNSEPYTLDEEEKIDTALDSLSDMPSGSMDDAREEYHKDTTTLDRRVQKLLDVAGVRESLQDTFLLRFGSSELNSEEAAQELGASIQAIDTRVWRAKEQIKKLGEEEVEAILNGTDLQ